jgi:hypothetical protein
MKFEKRNEISGKNIYPPGPSIPLAQAALYRKYMLQLTASFASAMVALFAMNPPLFSLLFFPPPYPPLSLSRRLVF